MHTTTKRKTYGNTWWGKHWIEALERIDSNRLARGKTYANTGKVENIKLEKSKLSAKVTGSWRSYYNINISLTKLDKKEIAIIKEKISQNPSIALELGLGHLPESFLSILEEENIQILPRRWKDINASCSCPDCANPCKHLAAVFYMMANEIDKDPFVLLQLKGLEKEELQKASEFIEKNNNKEEISFNDKFIAYNEIDFNPNKINLDDFNFSFTKLDVNSLVSLLADNPSFHSEGNFKTILLTLYGLVSKNINNIFNNYADITLDDSNDFFFYYSKYEYKKTILSNNFFVKPHKGTLKELKGKLTNIIDIEHNLLDVPLHIKQLKVSKLTHELPLFDTKTNSINLTLLKGFVVSGYPIIDYFLSQPIDIDNEDTTETFKFFNIISSMALGLVKSNNYIPDVVYEKDFSKDPASINCSNFSIRYVPFLNNDGIKRQISILQEIMPENICIYENKF